MYKYILANGISAEEYNWFMQQRSLRTHCTPEIVARVIGGNAARNSSQTLASSPMPNQKINITK